MANGSVRRNRAKRAYSSPSRWPEPSYAARASEPSDHAHLIEGRRDALELGTWSKKARLALTLAVIWQLPAR